VATLLRKGKESKVNTFEKRDIGCAGEKSSQEKGKGRLKKNIYSANKWKRSRKMLKGGQPDVDRDFGEQGLRGERGTGRRDPKPYAEVPRRCHRNPKNAKSVLGRKEIEGVCVGGGPPHNIGQR